MTHRYRITAQANEFTDALNEQRNNHSDALTRLCEHVRELIDVDFRDFVHNGNEFDVSLRFVCTFDAQDRITVNVVRQDNSDDTTGDAQEIARIDPV